MGRSHKDSPRRTEGPAQKG